MMSFFISVEFPTTQEAPIMAFPLMKAPGRTSVSGPIMHGPMIVFVASFKNFMDLAI